MSHATRATVITISLVSIVVALGIDALTPGAAGAEIETPTQTSTTSAPVRRDTVEAEQATVIHAETTEERERVEWALGRFELAGLDLPALTIYAYKDRSHCGGLNGFFSKDEAGRREVHTCGVDFTLLHELAHAWADQDLDDRARAEFLQVAHATDWHNDDWHLSGSEHAANVIAWGLMDQRVNQTRTRPYDHAGMLDTFSILTAGGEPLWMAG